MSQSIAALNNKFCVNLNGFWSLFANSSETLEVAARAIGQAADGALTWDR